MTATQTAPAAPGATAAPGAAAPQPPGGLAGVLSSGDHKTVGRTWIMAALALGGFTLVCGLLLKIERAIAPGLQVFAGIESFWQFFTLYRVGLVFLFAVPLWIGLATFVVPLQLGARSVAFPRAAASALWVWLTGAGLLIASWAIDGGLAAGGRRRAVELSLLALALVVASLLAATVVLLTTIVTQRPAGMSLFRVPLFSWSMLVAGAVWLLSLPVLLANLAIMWVDLRGVTAVRYGAGPNLYEQVSWVFEQPQVFAFALPVLGVICEVVPVAFGRPQHFRPVMLGLIGAAGAFSFGAELQRFFAPSAPTTVLYVAAGVVLVVALVGLAGSWADLGVKAGRLPRFSAPLALSISALGVLAVAVLVGFVRVLGGMVGILRSFSRHNEVWQADLNSALAPLDDLRGTAAGSGLLDLVLLASVVGAVAGLFYWSPKIFGRKSSSLAGYGIAGLAGAGAVVVGVTGLVAGFLGQPERPSEVFDSTAAEVMAVLGAVGLIVFLVALAGVMLVALRGARVLSGGVLTIPDPWGGHTLEWASPSPPPAGNFTEPVPVVHSAAPLWASPEAAAAGDGGGET